MIEPRKAKITAYRPRTPRFAVNLDKWLNRDTEVPTFAVGCDFLDWLIEQEVVFSENLNPLHNLPELLPILAQWGGGACFPGAELRQNGWLQWGKYYLRLSAGARSLTVRRGNSYGRFIDLGGLAPMSWPSIVKGLKGAGIYRLPYPVSAGGVAAGLLDQLTPLSTDHLPHDVLTLAWQACKGGRMEGLTLGTYDGFASDLSSAYPAAARDLPRCDDPLLCQWRGSTDFQAGADYGLALIDVDIPRLRAGPVAVRIAPSGPDDDLELHFPTGYHRRVAVALPDMQLLNDLEIPFIIRKAWWGFVIRPAYPFRRLMDLLYRLRAADRDFAKVVSVAAVGQLGSVDDAATAWADEARWEARPYFAPVYFSHIYAAVRARIYRRAWQAGLENVHAFSIDGLITSCELRQELPGMGNWREESRGEYFLTGDYFKDRPGDDGRWRAAVAETPPGVAPDVYEATMDTYVSLPLAWQRRLEVEIGNQVPITNTLPLGQSHRVIPAGLTRADYLREAIPTWLKGLK